MTEEQLKYLRDTIKDPQAIEIIEEVDSDYDFMCAMVTEAYQAIEGGSMKSLFVRDDKHPDVQSWVEMAADIAYDPDELCDDCGEPVGEHEEEEDLKN